VSTAARPRITVAAVLERDGRFLLVKERDEGGAVVYNQPAGHLELGESLPQAVVREVLEETGWHFTPEYLVGIYQWRKPGTDISYLRFCFGGNLLEQRHESPPEPDILATEWHGADSIAGGALPLRSPLVARCVQDWQAGARHPMSLLHAIRI
jgi:8-oxo-dGTP pyrophosphatase MutT (NUDIX family)